MEKPLFDGVSTDVALAVEEMSRRESFGFLWNKCFRADVIREHKLQFNENFRFLEDEEFICRYWTHVKRMRFVPCAAYHYVLPDYNRKYVQIDNYALYVSLLKNASSFIQTADSVTMQKYTMGLFRNMMLSFQKHHYYEGWQRLREFSRFATQFHGYNKYMRVIRPWNCWIWLPILVVYCLFNRL